LVVVEAPAGCGKTYQGADYAREIAMVPNSGRLLILTHTHAACSVFAERTKGYGRRIEIRTLDSLISSVASAYHSGLDLPADIVAWVRHRTDGYGELAAKVAGLMRRHPMIAASLSHRHSVLICDEHQDSSPDQHAVVMALWGQGAQVRVFADPMQKIFRDKSIVGSSPVYDWAGFIQGANKFEQLDTPHRWTSGCPELGKWVLRSRELLKAGKAIDLRSGLPPSITVTFAENQAQRNLDYKLLRETRKPIDVFEQAQSSLLVLTHYSDTAQCFRAFFNRRIPLWEGHTRSGLETLVDALVTTERDRAGLAEAIVTFMGCVGKGFSPSAFGDTFQQEVKEGCVSSRRGKAAKIQDLARLLVAEPDHRGVAKVLGRLSELKDSDKVFAGVEIDCGREFRDAICLGDFQTATDGFAEITHRRSYSRPQPPHKAISTIHKAKGLECDSVILMPCDASTFPDKLDARCLLYVAISRAKNRLMLVTSRANPSPLLTV
jgi:DNA helicase-2/ATP-dependent DNA helicase PcrA